MVHGKQQSSRKVNATQKRKLKNPVKDPFKEYSDPTPLVIPVGFGPPARSQRDELMHMLQEQRLREEEDGYIETPEEADDFLYEDEGDLLFSQYELQEMQEDTPIDLEVPADESEDESPAEPSEEKTELSDSVEDEKQKG